MRTILNIINIAKVSEYLSMNSIQLKALYGGGTNLELPYKIYNIRRSVEWAYKNQPQAPTTEQKNELIKTANYLYSMCVAYSLRAEDIVNEGKTLTLVWTDLETAQMWLRDITGSGVLTDVNNWNTAFDLPTYGNPFSSVSIPNSTTIVLRNTGNINTTPYALFSPDLRGFFSANHLIEIIDTGILLHIGDSCFRYNTGLTLATFANVVELDADSPFGGCENLSTVEIPKLTFTNYGGFENCISLQTLNFPFLTHVAYYLFGQSALRLINAPLVTYIDDEAFSATNIHIANFPLCTYIGYGAFENCALGTINISSCTNLGGTTGDNNVFNNVYTGRSITLTVPSALMTCNEGNPDGDIQYLQANNTVTIIEV